MDEKYSLDTEESNTAEQATNTLPDTTRLLQSGNQVEAGGAKELIDDFAPRTEDNKDEVGTTPRTTLHSVEQGSQPNLKRNRVYKKASSAARIVIQSPSVDTNLSNTPSEKPKREINYAALATAFTGIATLVVGGFVYHNSTRTIEESKLQINQQHQIDEFNKVQERLASADVKVRAAAVLQLTDLAVQKEFGAPTVFTRKNYPLFSRSTSQLTLILLSEDDASVRASLLAGVQKIIEFVEASRDTAPQFDGNGKKVNPETDLILAQMIQGFADANVKSKNLLIKKLAEYGNVEDLKSEPTLRTLGTLTSLIRKTNEQTDKLGEGIDDSENVNCLNRLIRNDLYHEFKQADEAQRLLAKRSEETRKEQQRTDAKLLSQIEQIASRLRDSRDALVSCLKALECPEELAQFSVEDTASVKEVAKSMSAVTHYLLSKREYVYDTSSRTHIIDLSGCFLAASNLGGAHLEWINLSDTHLEGANLTGTHLEGSNLGGAVLERASLTSSFLQAARLSPVFAKDAEFVEAHLEGVSFYESELEGADFRGAYLSDGSLRAHIAGTNFSQAHLENTNLSGIGGSYLERSHINPNGVEVFTNFSGSNWKEGNFISPDSDPPREDQEARSWLETNFPY